MAQFTHVVPLGGNCRLTHNVRRHFDHAESYPADWWITPLPGLVAALEARFDPGLLYDPAALERVADPQGRHRYVRHRALGLLYVHDFPDMPRSVSEPVDWDAHRQRPLGRLGHVAPKLLALNAPENTILFVRYCLSRTDEVVADTRADLDRLRAVLMRLFDRAAVSLLLLSPSDRFDGCRTLPLNDPSADWVGDFDLWTAALATTGHSLSHPTRTRYAAHSPDAEPLPAAPEPTPVPRRSLLRRVARTLRRV